VSSFPRHKNRNRTCFQPACLGDARPLSLRPYGCHAPFLCQNQKYPQHLPGGDRVPVRFRHIIPVHPQGARHLPAWCHACCICFTQHSFPSHTFDLHSKQTSIITLLLLVFLSSEWGIGCTPPKSVTLSCSAHMHEATLNTNCCYCSPSISGSVVHTISSGNPQSMPCMRTMMNPCAPVSTRGSLQQILSSSMPVISTSG
jgi:hypothetical protein